LRLPQNLNNSLTGTTVCIKESVKYLWQTHQGLCGDSGSATYLIIVAVHLMLRDFFYTLFGHLHIELCSESIKDDVHCTLFLLEQMTIF
jgi:hypothetical protein